MQWIHVLLMSFFMPCFFVIQSMEKVGHFPFQYRLLHKVKIWWINKFKNDRRVKSNCKMNEIIVQIIIFWRRTQPHFSSLKNFSLWLYEEKEVHHNLFKPRLHCKALLVFHQCHFMWRGEALTSQTRSGHWPLYDAILSVDGTGDMIKRDKVRRNRWSFCDHY